MSLQATNQVLPSQAKGTGPLTVITMGAHTAAALVIKTQTLGAPTTTLELSLYHEAKFEAIRKSRPNGTYSMPEGIMGMLDKDGRMTASDYVAYRNDRRAAQSARIQKLKVFLHETRPFIYAKLNEDEVPQLTALSSKEHQGDNANEGSVRARDNRDDASSDGNEEYSPSSHCLHQMLFSSFG